MEKNNTVFYVHKVTYRAVYLRGIIKTNHVSIIKLNNVGCVMLGTSMDCHQMTGDRTMRTEFHKCPLDVRRHK
jgi:hypothetical protein